MFSGMALSSAPDTSPIVRLGISATPSTPTEMMPDATSETVVPSVVTTETLIGKSALLSFGGRICRPSRSASLSTATPAVTVIGPLALDSTAPCGMPDRVICAVSLSSALSMVIGRAMTVSSSPEAAPRFKPAPSATPATSMETVPVETADTSPSSVVDAETVSSRLPEKSAGGRIASPSSSPSPRVTLPSTTSRISPLRVMTAPSGMFDRVTESVSEPSVSSSDTSTVNGTARSSMPDAVVLPTAAPSATPWTVTSKVTGSEVAVVTSPVSGSVSVAVAVTVSWKSSALSASGVMVRPSSCAGVSVTLELALVAVKVRPPGSVRVAPAGISEIVTEVT